MALICMAVGLLAGGYVGVKKAIKKNAGSKAALGISIALYGMLYTLIGGCIGSLVPII